MKDIQKKLESCECANHWKRIGIFPHNGINVALFSLRTRASSGIGEFLDLLPLISWCKELKLDIIQLLPVNDSAHDPSPYNAVSACALNPIYLSLHALPFLDEHPQLKKKLSEFKSFNEQQRVHYHDVQSHKIAFLRKYFELAGDKLLSSNGFIDFRKSNLWLEPYGLFKALKDLFGQNSWLTWPKEMREPNKREFQHLQNDHRKDITFYIAMQYLCYNQFKSVKQQANAQGVFIKGDVPILISKDSADAWYSPELFDLELSAGAPPDPYNLEGQNWGFPIYRWDEVKRSHHSWWKRRLLYASHFYDLYRIDHVIGFFRIWAIPEGKTAKEGMFVPADEHEWLSHGKHILHMMIHCNPMLALAEDLGTVPQKCRKCLETLGIPGTKVMRWERAWEEDKRFYRIDEYPPISMTTVSTHDSETLGLWWKNFPDEASDFAAFKGWNYHPTLSEDHRREILWDSHHTTSLFHINLLQEYLALFPEFISENPEEERINIPGKVLPSNWTYRFKPYLEDMVRHEGLKKEMEKILLFPKPKM